MGLSRVARDGDGGGVDSATELLAYVDRFSVAPGESIDVMVSSTSEFDVELVQLFHGDLNPDGPGFKGRQIPCEVGPKFPARTQAIRPGSFARIDDTRGLDEINALTLHAWIYPTTPADGRLQGIVSWWSETGGYGLFLAPDGNPILLLGGPGAERAEGVTLGQALEPGRWYSISAVIRAEEKEGEIWVSSHSAWPHVEERTSKELEDVEIRPYSGPLLLAAATSTEIDGCLHASGFFNGRLEQPSIYGAALDHDDIHALASGAATSTVQEHALLASWDFSRGIGGSVIQDISARKRDGVLVNMPTRAVTGHRWLGHSLDFRQSPEEYAAIHFHADDLEDAEWDPTFTLPIPSVAASGVYAAHLTSETETDYVPFVVRPAKGGTTAPIAVLLPTLTYLAYANERLREDPDQAEPGEPGSGLKADPQFGLDPRDEMLAARPDLGLSLYDLHVDGSPNCYSTSRRPILNMRPDYRMWLTHAPRHLGADLYLIDWLTEQGFEYDVLTDDDLDDRGQGLLDPYQVVLTGSHPEYWTESMLVGLEGYLDDGGRLMYLGGNGFYWVTSRDPQRPYIAEVRRGNGGTRNWDSPPGETHHSTTGEPGGLWRHRGRPPNRLVGVGFTSQGWQDDTPGYRLASAIPDQYQFVFDGVDDDVIGDFGLVMGGAAGDEIDRFDPKRGSPSHTAVLASSSGHSDHYQLVIEDLMAVRPGLGGVDHPDVRADMTILETHRGGAVFSVGSICWAGSLSFNDYDNNVSRVTENVLRRFLQPEQLTEADALASAGRTQGGPT